MRRGDTAGMADDISRGFCLMSDVTSEVIFMGGWRGGWTDE